MVKSNKPEKPYHAFFNRARAPDSADAAIKMVTDRAEELGGHGRWITVVSAAEKLREVYDYQLNDKSGEAFVLRRSWLDVLCERLSAAVYDEAFLRAMAEFSEKSPSDRNSVSVRAAEKPWSEFRKSFA